MKVFQQSLVGGLGSNTIKIAVAGVHTVTTKTTCLTPSGMSVTIAQSGSTTSSVTTPATAESQTHIELNGKFNCAVGDVLTVTTASSAPVDQPPSLIKTTINIRQGV